MHQRSHESDAETANANVVHHLTVEGKPAVALRLNLIDLPPSGEPLDSASRGRRAVLRERVDDECADLRLHRGEFAHGVG